LHRHGFFSGDTTESESSTFGILIFVVLACIASYGAFYYLSRLNGGRTQSNQPVVNNPLQATVGLQMVAVAQQPQANPLINQVTQQQAPDDSGSTVVPVGG
jgi:hypothetical protein